MRRTAIDKAGAIGLPLVGVALTALFIATAQTKSDDSSQAVLISKGGSFAITGNARGLYPRPQDALRRDRLQPQRLCHQGHVDPRQRRERRRVCADEPRRRQFPRLAAGRRQAEAPSLASDRHAPERARRMHGSKVQAHLLRQGGEVIRRALVLAAIVLAACSALAPGTAQAGWSPSGSGSGYAKAQVVPAGSTPAASVSNRDVTVTWSASTPRRRRRGRICGQALQRLDRRAADHRRGLYGDDRGARLHGDGVPPGSWRYTVTPLIQGWVGGESAKSSTAAVSSPTLSFTSSTTITSLPTTLNGTVASFAAERPSPSGSTTPAAARSSREAPRRPRFPAAGARASAWPFRSAWPTARTPSTRSGAAARPRERDHRSRRHAGPYDRWRGDREDPRRNCRLHQTGRDVLRVRRT